MPKHYRLSPSGSPRIAKYDVDLRDWVPVCPGSLKVSMGQTSPTSVWSEEGTDLHKLTEQARVTGKVPEINDVIYRNWIDFSLNSVAEIREQFAPGYVEEHEVHIKHSDIENFGGTIDLLIRGFLKLTGQPCMWIADDKYGFEEVEAAYNPQLYCYGELALDRETWGQTPFTPTVINMSIIQPRNKKFETWGTDIQSISYFMKRYLEFVEKTWLYPGPKQCQYCPAIKVCPAVRQDALTLNEWQKQFGLDLTNEQLAWACQTQTVMNNYFKQMKQEAKNRAIKGIDIPGYEIRNRVVGKADWKPQAYKNICMRFGIPFEQAYTPMSKSAFLEYMKTRLDKEAYAALESDVDKSTIPGEKSPCLVKTKKVARKSEQEQPLTGFEQFAKEKN